MKILSDKLSFIENTGFKTVLFSLIFFLLVLFIYQGYTNPETNTRFQFSEQLKHYAILVFVTTMIISGGIAIGIWNIYTKDDKQDRNIRNVKYFISIPFKLKKYIIIAILSSIIYGIFFSFLSQIFIYVGDRSLTNEGILIPSFNIIPCCNALGYVPMSTIYLHDHFLILLIPINTILLTIVSILVGINTSLNLFMLRSLKDKLQNKSYFIGSTGATFGLFIGCPTCAGGIIAALFGFGSGTSIAILASFQTVFILLSIPILIISPFLIAKKMMSKNCNISTKLN